MIAGWWAALTGLALVKKLSGFGLLLTPLGAVAGPIMASAASVLGEVVKAFGRGVAATFANPAVFLVLVSAAGGGYWYAFGAQQVKISKAEKAVVVMRDGLEQNCKPDVAARIRRSAGVKPKPKPSIVEWIPPGLNPF